MKRSVVTISKVLWTKLRYETNVNKREEKSLHFLGSVVWWANTAYCDHWAMLIYGGGGG